MLQSKYKRRFLDPAYRTARRLLEDEIEAREVSEATVNVVMARFAAGKLSDETTKRFETDNDQDSYILSYLRKATRNAVIDHVRAGQAEARRRQGFAVGLTDFDWSIDPVKADCRRELIEHVRDAVDGLPGKLRDVVQRHYVEEKTCREISNLMSISEGTIKFWLSESRQRLSSQLANIHRD
jgi:RNA polymerase sigma factor (sigma-70 family)